MWAAGCVLYELATLQRPFRGSSVSGGEAGLSLRAEPGLRWAGCDSHLVVFGGSWHGAGNEAEETTTTKAGAPAAGEALLYGCHTSFIKPGSCTSRPPPSLLDRQLLR